MQHAHLVAIILCFGAGSQQILRRNYKQLASASVFFTDWPSTLDLPPFIGTVAIIVCSEGDIGACKREFLGMTSSAKRKNHYSVSWNCYAFH